MQREVRKTVSVVFSDVAGSTALAVLNRELESELEVTLAVRTGVSTGLVLAGDERAGHAFVGGDTVNLAARLERAAGAGQVLLGEATYRLVGGAVLAQPLARFVPRGRGGGHGEADRRCGGGAMGPTLASRPERVSDPGHRPAVPVVTPGGWPSGGARA